MFIYPTFLEASVEAKKITELFGQGAVIRRLNDKWQIDLGGDAGDKFYKVMEELEKESEKEDLKQERLNSKESELDKEYGNEYYDDELPGYESSESDDWARSDEEGWFYE